MTSEHAPKAVENAAPERLNPTLNQHPQPLVLVIDDDRAMRLLLRRSMEQAGYLVSEAVDGAQGLLAFERLRPDLILLDAMMPIMDGFTACAKIQEMPGGRDTPVLLITALNDTASVDRAFAAGATDYITKPIHWPVLRQRVRRIIEAKQVSDVVYLRDRAITASSNGLIITNALTQDHPITYVNPAVERLMGYSAEEIQGCTYQIFLDLTTDADEWATLESAVLSAQEYQTTLKHYRKDGTLVWVQLSVSPVHDSRGRLSHYVWVQHDVTARIRAEEDLQTMNEQLTVWINQLEQRTRENTLLSEMSELFQACRESEEAYMVIAQISQRLLPYASGTLAVLKPGQPLVDVVAAWGTQLPHLIFMSDHCWALRRGRIHVVNDVQDGLVCSHITTMRPSAFVCVPMLAQGELLGVLTVTVAEPELFSADTQRLSVTVAEQSALALANLRLQETLRSQSIHDPLTGLFNRRFMYDTLERELRRAERNHQSVCVIMLDIDHFKYFNDTFGHDAGDALLQELSRFLTSHIRQEDIACRYGGEEFILILPGLTLNNTEQRAEQLRCAVKSLTVQHAGQMLGTITLSLGVSIYPAHGSTSDKLLKSADIALYQAKRSGRDRVVVAE